jgi:plasmid replication initiation protein
MLKKTEVVVKSNRLIEASYRLSLNEQRIILYAICQCREEDKALSPEQPVTITAESFTKQFSLSEAQTNVYRQLKEAMAALYIRSVTIHDTDPATNKARVRETRWISEKAYIDGSGHIQVIFTSEVIKYISRLEREFTSYQLEKVAKMTSHYAVRIYEILAQYRTTGKRMLNLIWLRNALQIEPNEYKLTANFMDRVLDMAVDQINKHSDITVSYKPRKTSRAITDFEFKIREKEHKTASDQIAREELEALGQPRLDTETNEEF